MDGWRGGGGDQETQQKVATLLTSKGIIFHEIDNWIV